MTLLEAIFQRGMVTHLPKSYQIYINFFTILTYCIWKCLWSYEYHIYEKMNFWKITVLKSKKIKTFHSHASAMYQYSVAYIISQRPLWETFCLQGLYIYLDALSMNVNTRYIWLSTCNNAICRNTTFVMNWYTLYYYNVIKN